MKPTDKQMDLIHAMEELVDDTFQGQTKKEASEWIDRHIERYRLESLGRWHFVKDHF